MRRSLLLASPITIVVADDHPIVRAGVKDTLGLAGGFLIAGEAESPQATLRILSRLEVSILLLDMDMAGYPTKKLIDECHVVRPRLKIVILSEHAEFRHLQPLRKAKIRGFIHKKESPQRLIEALRIIAGGQTWYSQDVSEKIKGGPRAAGRTKSELTARERQVLEFMTLGRDNHYIAAALNLTPQAIRRHAANIYCKLGVKNRVEAVLRFARQAGG